RNPRVGKKLLATGNGRCNFTNTDLDVSHFHGSDPGFINAVLDRFSGQRTLSFFRELGIEPRQEEAGKIFPASGQASSIVDVLRYQADHLGVALICDTDVKSVQKNGSLFTVNTAVGCFRADAVIIATGGKAGPQFGSSGAGYTLSAPFGHRLVKPVPALVQLRLKAPFLKAIAGVKLQGQVSIFQGNTCVNSAAGEILFTNYGISGPPVLALSRTASKILNRGGQPMLKVSILTHQRAKDIARYLQRRFQTQHHKTAELSLVGFIHKRLIVTMLKEAGIPLKIPAAQINQAQINCLASLLASWTFPITDTNGWTAAQVTAGGLHQDHICPQTLGSTLLPQLYFAGEIINVDGDCGGYNLQWAWSSGFVAGTAAAQPGP
ncbi:MAG TPA: NAD(P)/FAD-dependent oxidoreductase, partial [bacterium]|nr:NAD(P)/FAD-dependent oxidoreductase [bacterium]